MLAELHLVPTIFLSSAYSWKNNSFSQKYMQACNYFETETSFKFLINFGFLKALAN